MRQLALPLAWPADPHQDDFLISPSNRDAVHQLDHWSAWPVMTALLVGPRKSGRSLLARLFAARSGGRIIDDAQGQPEDRLFHAWNRAQDERRPLLMVSDAPPPAWSIGLPDLRSRLAASPVLAIAPPDDALVAALLGRGFERRRIDARPDLLAWIAPRIERSHLAVFLAVAALEDATAGQKRRLSIPLARATLAAAGMIADRVDDPQQNG